MSLKKEPVRLDAQASVCPPNFLICLRIVAKVLKNAIARYSPINSTQYCILLAIRRGNGKRTVGQIANELSLTSSAVSIAARRLIAQEMVQIQNDENDKRISFLCITENGDRVINEIDAVAKDAINDLWIPLSRSQKEISLKSSVQYIYDTGRLRVEERSIHAVTAYVEGVLISYSEYARAADLHRLHLNEVIALYWLCSQQKMIGMTELAEVTQIRLYHMSLLIESLKQRGLVTCTLSQDDKRVRLLESTPSGVELISRILKDFEVILKQHFQKTSQAELEYYFEIMEEIVNDQIRRHRFSI